MIYIDKLLLMKQRVFVLSIIKYRKMETHVEILKFGIKFNIHGTLIRGGKHNGFYQLSPRFGRKGQS